MCLLPEVCERYVGRAAAIFTSAGAHPEEDLAVQLAKVWEKLTALRMQANQRCRYKESPFTVHSIMP